MDDENFTSLCATAPPQKVARNSFDIHANTTTQTSNIAEVFKQVAAFEELEAEWLIDGWVPKGQITLLASDGGIGKTTIACNIIAAVSRGIACILDPNDTIRRDLQRVMLFTSEDSISRKLRFKMRLMGANIENVIAPNPSVDKSGIIGRLKFGSKELDDIIRAYHPALCVFDPIQAYVPTNINMGSRNAMRDCMAHLTALGEEIGCTFLVLCHSNKRKNASGRDRISDSSDLWDISQSVIMAGRTTEQDVRYLSNEKNNYAKLQETVLFSISSHGLPVHRGFSGKRDYDYVMEASIATKPQEPFNEQLFEALKDAANPFTPVRFHYAAFKEQYGAMIYGGKQPVKALEAMKQPMEDAGFSLVMKQIKIDGKNGKGFIIVPIDEFAQSNLADSIDANRAQDKTVT